ncbi:hypothetical protein SCOCK_490007 [Actinacidiphila cocklensis]|uniref:Uncharacterized protein n=1 Tax=Actinacidiphila cocklensis TaxID=887465 RepID=A0A9W4GTU8_9ACTN|nr:hypothetical protein SCOCK_490007 [Actinacidiphila cocklensis]
MDVVDTERIPDKLDLKYSIASLWIRKHLDGISTSIPLPDRETLRARVLK